jgi:hypothetical protein
MSLNIQNSYDMVLAKRWSETMTFESHSSVDFLYIGSHFKTRSIFDFLYIDSRAFLSAAILRRFQLLTFLYIGIPGVKQPERESDNSLPSSAEVKNAWSYTSTPPNASSRYDT